MRLLSMTILLSLIAFSTFAVDSAGKLTTPDELSKNEVFSGSSQINGSTIFFGMEKINSDIDEQNWQNYAHHALGVSDLYKRFNNSISKNQDIIFDDFFKERTGLSEAEFNDYLVSFKKFMQDKSSLEVATNIAVGASAFFNGIRRGRYVVYASKNKVSGKYPFPKDFTTTFPFKNQEAILLNLQNNFSDLIMVLYSWGQEENSSYYSNRGIFKNPISCFLDGKKFPGLSLKLHGFSAYVSKTFFGKEDLKVNAAYAMTCVLVNPSNKWQKGDFILNGKDFVDCTEEEKKASFGDTPCRIKTNALIQKFAR